MDELIRKQDALDAAIKADMENHNGILSEKRARVFEEHISILPPVQMDDAISRQAAIYIASGYCHPANVANELAKLPSVQPERRYTVRELSVFRHGISLSLCSKKSAQRWHYDEDTAIEIEFLEHLYEKVGEDMRGNEDGTD